MRWIAAWLLYWLASAVAPLTHLLDAEWPYRVFNRLALLSDAVQGDGPGPWKDPPGAPHA